MDSKIVFQRLNSGNANELSSLAKEIYKEHYLHLWHEGGADWYMNEYAYPSEKLKNELADTNNAYFIAYEDKQAIGYLKIKLHSVLEGAGHLDTMEIERIYLYKNATGRGIGKQLIRFAFTIAKEQNKQLVFLKAMDSSLDAIAFYQKSGFEQCGIFSLPMPAFTLMKEAYRGMVIMKKELKVEV
jgi:ribosomal protein S18 acetylase RimI-like enzyme